MDRLDPARYLLYVRPGRLITPPPVGVHGDSSLCDLFRLQVADMVAGEGCECLHKHRTLIGLHPGMGGDGCTNVPQRAGETARTNGRRLVVSNPQYGIRGSASMGYCRFIKGVRYEGVLPFDRLAKLSDFQP